MKVKVVNEETVNYLIDNMNEMQRMFGGDNRDVCREAYKVGVHDVMKRAVEEKEMYTFKEVQEMVMKNERFIMRVILILISLMGTGLGIFVFLIKHYNL